MPRRQRPDWVSRRPLDARLDEVDSLREPKRWVEALGQLRVMAERDPNSAKILGQLLNVSYELHDVRRYLDRPASDLQTFRRFLQRWPQHERAAEALEMLADLDWISPRAIQDLRTTLKPHARNTSHDRVVADAMRRFLPQHPEMPALVPVLFDRGDPT